MRINETSDELMAYRAKLKKSDDRKEYASKKKYGKTYKQFVDKKLDDREEYKNRMKYGKNYKGDG